MNIKDLKSSEKPGSAENAISVGFNKTEDAHTAVNNDFKELVKSIKTL